MESNKQATRLPNLSAEVVEKLKELIYSGEMAPGERINEANLASQMGISRGPIREAVKVLAGLGLVSAVVNKGVFVKSLTLRDAMEIYDLRALIFGFAAERACDNLTKETKSRLSDLLLEMDRAAESAEGSTYYKLNLEFHNHIMLLGGNSRATQAYESYVKQLHLIRRRYFDSPGNMRKSNMEHKSIFDAISAYDHNQARIVASNHVLAGRIRALQLVEDMTTPA